MAACETHLKDYTVVGEEFSKDEIPVREERLLNNLIPYCSNIDTLIDICTRLVLEGYISYVFILTALGLLEYNQHIDKITMKIVFDKIINVVNKNKIIERSVEHAELVEDIEDSSIPKPRCIGTNIDYLKFLQMTVTQLCHISKIKVAKQIPKFLRETLKIFFKKINEVEFNQAQIIVPK